MLRLDDAQPSAEKPDGLRLAVIDMLEPPLRSLQASDTVVKQQAAGIDDDNSVLRLLAMQRMLGLQAVRRLRQSAAQLWKQPVKTLGPFSAWHCWRAVRQLGR